MVLIGGIIIDRIGVKKSNLPVFAALRARAVLTALTPTLSVMAAGRLLFGLGAESLIVAITTALAQWFRGKELSFAFGLNLTIARLGSFSRSTRRPGRATPTRAGRAAPDRDRSVRLADRGAIYWVMESGAVRRTRWRPPARPTRSSSATSVPSDAPTGSSSRSA